MTGVVAAHAPTDATALLDTTVAHLRALVGFATVSADSNLALIAYVRDTLAAHGVDAEVFPDATGTKAALWARLGGPADVPGLVLSGHTDVVPVVGQRWTRPPFTLTEETDAAGDVRLFGRGTTDMKGFIACVLATLPAWTDARLARPVWLSLSYDEEIGCLGVRPMLAEIARRRPLPFGVLIGEPTCGLPVTGHKGKVAMRCDVTGRSCHSALAPDGVNAIETAAQMIDRIRTLAADFARDGVRDDRYRPPFATVQTGLVGGGTGVNVVPNRCSFTFEARSTRRTDLDHVVATLRRQADAELLPAMHAVAPEAAIDFATLSEYPALDTPADAPLAQWLSALTGDRAPGTVSFGSEGGLFAAAGMPAVLCGPGDMAQGHKPDEFILRDALAQYLGLLERLAARLRD
jgi:acetylornithine deacetylase